MTGIAENLRRVRERIADACRSVGRAPESVCLVAVSKTFPVEDIRVAVAAGQRVFGESYVQEALPKIASLRGETLEWHFVGPVQSNKTREIAAHFDWVHSVDRLKIAQRLADQRPLHLPPLQVCVQVNLSGESTKFGCSPDEAASLCDAVAALPRLMLRGLMCIPAPRDSGPQREREFAQLRNLLDKIRVGSSISLDSLSVGMSDDLEPAIAAGSTHLRVGTACFGMRT